MIWFAYYVTRGRETVAERILRGYFRDCRIKVEVAVPVKHVVRRTASIASKRCVSARPCLPGMILLGVQESGDLPVVELEGFRFLHGFMPGERGAPLVFSDADIVRILGEMHQRPVRLRPGARMRKVGTSLEILDGPYAGRTARVLESPDGKDVTSMVITGTAKWFDELEFDRIANRAYNCAPG